VTQAQQVVKAVEQGAEKAQAVVTEAAAQAADYLDQAKTLLAEKKVQEASGLLEKLAGMTLTAEQQQTLGGLKTEAAQILKDIEKGLGDLKSSVAEKNYTNATVLVSKLASYQLSPEQQQVYDTLKTQAKQLLGSGATEQGAKALNNLLGR
jgi:predicted NBD/HSP70 family sugar kinase